MKEVGPWHAWKILSNQTRPPITTGCQVNIKCFYAKRTCLGSNYRNISSLTLVQKVIPGYLQRTVDNYSRAISETCILPSLLKRRNKSLYIYTRSLFRALFGLCSGIGIQGINAQKSRVLSLYFRLLCVDGLRYV
jgi:hypothetical protein